MLGCLFGFHNFRPTESMDFAIEGATHVCRVCGLQYSDIDGEKVFTASLSPSERKAAAKAKAKTA